jgi:hypothetical protein
MPNRFLVAVLIAASSSLSGCDVLEETAQRPWNAYAWQKENKRHQIWFSNYETYRDCIEATRTQVNSSPNNQWYSEPFGCGYSSNSYWRTLFFNNRYAKMTDFQCIARSSSTDAYKSHVRYGPVLQGYPKPSGNSYCVD